MAFEMFHRGKQLCYDGELSEGLNLIEDALRRRPKEILFLSFKAQFLYENRKYKDAISCAQNVIRVKSKDVKANNVCYGAALKTGDLDKCQQALSKMMRCRARVAKNMMKITEKTEFLGEYTARRERVAEHLREKNSEQAIVEAEKCLLRGKYDSKVLRYKIEALILQNRFDDGIKTYESVLPVATEMMAFHLLAEVTGICYFLKNQLREAIGVFRTYSHPKNLDLASILTDVLESHTAAETSLSNDSPEECVGHVGKALAALKKFPIRNDSFERALKKFEREADLKTRTYPPALSKALLAVDEHIGSGDYKTADIVISQLLQWARKNPNQLPGEFSLVQWERKLEDVKEATRISVLTPTLWTKTRALAALRVKEITSKSRVEMSYKAMATRYHPDKHSTESPEWKSMYNMLMQELGEAKKYLLKTLTETGQELFVGIKRGGCFSFNEEQRNYNEKVKRRRQETNPGNIS